MATELPVLRWGIVGCGLISSWFVSDLCLQRPEATTRHVVQAVGSSSLSKGSAFAAQHCPSQQPRVYDSYDAVYRDPDVDIVYVGTPHVLHRQNTLAAIAAGKHVLCEKPLALNAADARAMVDAARQRGVFLMEAVWTRFFPIVSKLQSLIHEDRVIGDPASVAVDFGLYMPICEGDPSRRTASRELGAGALLDIGIYTLTWASMVLDAHPSRRAAKAPEPSLTASMVFASEVDPDKQVDEQTAVVLRYPDLKAHAVCTSSLLYKTGDVFARIHGARGSISVGGPAASKPSFLLVNVQGEPEERLDFAVPGWGFHYEADAVAQSIREGKTENETCPLDTTLTIMARMDEARRQCGLVYPGEEES